MASETKQKVIMRMDGALEHLKRDLSGLRTGRASLSLLDSVKVDYYGNPTPLKQVANLAVPESRLITVQPWEPQMIKDIEKALLASGLGLTPSNDGKLIRIPIPPLTEERRKELVKQVHHRAEEGRGGGGGGRAAGGGGGAARPARGAARRAPGRVTLRELAPDDEGPLVTALLLVRDEPEVRAAYLRHTSGEQAALAEALARRESTAPGDLRPALLAGMFNAAALLATLNWAPTGRHGLQEAVDQHFRAIHSALGGRWSTEL
jgi:hypothetical protein